MAQTHHRDSGNELTINNTTDEDGFLKIYGKNADALILGDATHEGGDIKVYRDGSNNLQLSLDADAASNALALSVYGGVVAQNYLTIGQTTLNTDRQLYVSGTMGASVGIYLGTTGVSSNVANQLIMPFDIYVSSGTATHTLNFRIDGNDIIVVQATGDGAGGIINKAIGLYGGSPTTQAAAISDPAESIAANNAAIDAILAALRNLSVIAT